jgi:hypothetical protein
MFLTIDCEVAQQSLPQQDIQGGYVVLLVLGELGPVLGECAEAQVLEAPLGGKAALVTSKTSAPGTLSLKTTMGEVLCSKCRNTYRKVPLRLTCQAAKVWRRSALESAERSRSLLLNGSMLTCLKPAGGCSRAGRRSRGSWYSARARAYTSLWFGSINFCNVQYAPQMRRYGAAAYSGCHFIPLLYRCSRRLLEAEAGDALVDRLRLCRPS